MTDYEKIVKDFFNMCLIIRSSKNPECKSLMRAVGWINGQPYIHSILKITGEKRYNAIRVYAPTGRGNVPWFDFTYQFCNYVDKPKEQRVVTNNGQLISWINLEDVYIMLYIEKAPIEEDQTNTKRNSIEQDDIFESLVDEATYFNVRCKELSTEEKESVHPSDLEPPPKFDSVMLDITKMCSLMKGE